MSSSNVKMWVEAPELRQTKGLISKQVMTYNVIVDGCHMGGVRKRYSEFEEFRMCLEKRYGTEGVLVPPLPPKKMVGNQENDFIKRRMTGLSLFCGGLANNPFLMNDLTTERFLTHSSEEILGMSIGGGGQLAALEDHHDQHDLISSNVGYCQWSEYLSGFPLPMEPDTTLERVKGELDIIERNLRALFEAGKSLTVAIGQYARALQGLSQAAHEFHHGEKLVKQLNNLSLGSAAPSSSSSATAAAMTRAVEEEDEEEANGEGGRGHNHHHHQQQQQQDVFFTKSSSVNTVPRLMSKTAECYTGSTEGYMAAGEQLDLLFSDLIEYEIWQIHALRALMGQREELQKDILKLQRRLYSLQSTPLDRRDRFRPEVEQLQNKISKEEVRYYKYTKALICFTIPFIARSRNENLNRAFANLSAMMSSSTSAAYFALLKQLEDLRFDPNEIVDEANEASTRLILPPVSSIIFPPTSPRRKDGGGKKNTSTDRSGSRGAISSQLSSSASASSSKPGSFLRTTSSSSNGAAGSGGGWTTTKVADSILTAAIPGPDGQVRAPWDDDPDHDDPFTTTV